MLETFCAASNIKALLQRSCCPSALVDCAPLIEDLFEGLRNSKSAAEIDALSSNISGDTGKTRFTSQSISWDKFVPLDEAVFRAVQKSAPLLKVTLLHFTPTREAVPLNRCIIRGSPYATLQASEADSLIFYQRSGIFTPGVIRGIYRFYCRTDPTMDSFEEYTLLAIHALSPVDVAIEDPFLEFPDFGAGLWSNSLSPEPDILPSTSKICHAIWRPWSQEIRIVKNLDPVRVSEI